MGRILKRIQEIVAEQLEIEPEDVVLNAHFEDDLGADSLDVVELVMKVEDEFDIDIEDDYASQISTVQHVLTYLQFKLGIEDDVDDRINNY